MLPLLCVSPTRHFSLCSTSSGETSSLLFIKIFFHVLGNGFNKVFDQCCLSSFCCDAVDGWCARRFNQGFKNFSLVINSLSRVFRNHIFVAYDCSKDPTTDQDWGCMLLVFIFNVLRVFFFTAMTSLRHAITIIRRKLNLTRFSFFLPSLVSTFGAVLDMVTDR